MYYVYLLRSEAFPDHRYTGFTTDLKARLKSHNEGASNLEVQVVAHCRLLCLCWRTKGARVRALSQVRFRDCVRHQTFLVITADRTTKKAGALSRPAFPDALDVRLTSSARRALKPQGRGLALPLKRA